MRNIASILLLAVLAGCHSPAQKDPHHIKVGVEAGPEFSMAQAAQKVAKDKFGLDVELVSFNDYVMPNESLRQGDIDINVFQNRPFLETQSKQRGYNFAVLGNTFVYPLAGYSKKIKSISELANGNTIIIPNDPTNSGRSLLLLQTAGLIKLKDGVGLFPTINDITDNPKNLQILELEAPQLPRALDDQKVTIAVINNTFAGPAGLISKRDGIIVEDGKSPYVNIIVCRTEDKDREALHQFARAYESPEVAAVADSAFKGGAIKGW